jgi:hypothetical protein
MAGAMKKTMPKGYRDKTGASPRVAVMFPEDLFAQIKTMAVKEDKSFSTMVCELCRVGIFDLEESDASEIKEVEHVQ